MAGVAWIINRHGVLVDVPADRLEDILGLVPGSRLATPDEVPGDAPTPDPASPKPVKKQAARRKSPPAADAK